MPSPYHTLSTADLKDIQAGPVVPLLSRNKIFIFFAITNATNFRKHFKRYILPFITTSDDARKARSDRLPGQMKALAGINVAFSKAGLDLLLGNGNIGDKPFEDGQLAGAEDLGDNLSNWLPYFKDNKIHGLLQFTGYPFEKVQNRTTNIVNPHLDNGITVIFKHIGRARPDDLKDHEHFGFHDGISQPFVHFEDDSKQNREPLPGQTQINPGVLILGQTADPKKDERPEWSKNGSILVYRHLKQLVPEWNKFLEDVVKHSIVFPLTATDPEFKKRVDYLGARLMGRWKSGLPVVLTPYQDGKFPEDDPTIGKDKQKNNVFDYGPRDSNSPRKQLLCPFAAHTRKTGPRTDIAGYRVEETAISRRGIAYGKELTPEELAKEKTLEERGLSFVCFQSSMEFGVEADGIRKEVGFPFIQKSWSNNIDFPENTGDVQPGFDPIIGQQRGINPTRSMTGYDATDTNATLYMPDDFVIAQGGEYFFLPSMTVLRNL